MLTIWWVLTFHQLTNGARFPEKEGSVYLKIRTQLSCIVYSIYPKLTKNRHTLLCVVIDWLIFLAQGISIVNSTGWLMRFLASVGSLMSFRVAFVGTYLGTSFLLVNFDSSVACLLRVYSTSLSIGSFLTISVMYTLPPKVQQFLLNCSFLDFLSKKRSFCRGICW